MMKVQWFKPIPFSWFVEQNASYLLKRPISKQYMYNILNNFYAKNKKKRISKTGSKVFWWFTYKKWVGWVSTDFYQFKNSEK